MVSTTRVWKNLEIRGLIWFIVLIVAIALQFALVWREFIQPVQMGVLNFGWVFLVLLSLIESFFEEVIFRFLPVYLVFKYSFNMKFLIASIVGSSVAFGFYHLRSTTKSELITAGMIYCVVFVLSGGLTGHFKKALFSSWFVHVVVNLSWIFSLGSLDL